MKTRLLGAAAMLALVLAPVRAARAEAAGGLPPAPPPLGPYVLSETAPGAPLTETNPPSIAVRGHILTIADGAGYFANLTPGAQVTGSLAVSSDILNPTGAWTATTFITCGAASSICDCGCYYASGPGFPASTPGTTNCPASSYAKNHPATFGCSSNVLSGSTSDIVVNGLSFALTFADGSMLAQDPNQSMLAYFYGNQLTVQGGPSSSDLLPFNLPGSSSVPDSSLLCNTSSAGFCRGNNEVQWIYSQDTELGVSEVDVNYYLPGNQSGVPDGSVRVAVDHEWVPGTPDPGGPMIWQNAWSSTVFYNPNDVVTFNGVTYLATSPNQAVQPDQTPAQWTAIGSASGGGAGSQGPAGAAGPAGAQGPAGAVGPVGPPGESVVGPEGPAGAAGPQGPEGPAGTNGAPGLSVNAMTLAASVPGCPYGGAEFTVGSQVAYACNGAGVVGMSLSPGDSHCPGGGAEFTVGDQAPLFACNGPAGGAGAAGAMGPQGPQGPTGAQGSPGVQGLPGLTGPIGTTGATGVAGAPGAVGAVGPEGITGPTGAAGPAGAMGPAGPRAFPTLSVASNLSVSAASAQDCFLVDTTGAARTISLPAAATVENGHIYIAKKMDASPNAMIINVQGGGKIDGSSSLKVVLPWRSIELVSDGVSKWVVVSSTP